METFIVDFGRLDLLDFSMCISLVSRRDSSLIRVVNKYWINQGAPNRDFWGHEFSKHATCTSTFDVTCYGPKYKKHQDVIDFYEAAIRAFKQYPTFDILAS